LADDEVFELVGDSCFRPVELAAAVAFDWWLAACCPAFWALTIRRANESV